MEDELQKYLKKLDKDIKKQIESIPSDVLKVIMDRAYKDAQQLFNDNNTDNFKQVTYILYRAYILGMLIEKTNNKEENPINRNNIFSIVK